MCYRCDHFLRKVSNSKKSCATLILLKHYKCDNHFISWQILKKRMRVLESITKNGKERFFGVAFCKGNCLNVNYATWVNPNRGALFLYIQSQMGHVKKETLFSYVHHQFSVRLDAVLICWQLCPSCFSIQEIMVL